MKLSIIIPVYNQEKDLLEICIRSAINQSIIEKEILIIDDGSTNGSIEEVIKSLFDADAPKEDELEIKFDKKTVIKLIRKENGGVSSALNLGIEKAQHDYISWLSSDDYFYPEKSYIQLANMIETETKFSFTGFRDVRLRLGKPHSISNYVSQYGFSIVAKEQLHQDLKEKFPVSFICGDTVIFHKDVIEKVGKFDETFLYMQDYEMWLRISKEFNTLSCGDVFMVHHTHENQMMYIFGEDHFKQNRMREEAELKGKYL